ncbi:ABA INSENSITIVE GROWTH 1 [Hibiscus trionum]|uniref:ABA INSENSITIVE GROWTH 1 n=1 Tax=Hibiscus trionum TaxID=183268 RepID=A0A9W7ILW5_HIBTR|nr:ABA INSENSITIVE GROWTH 1 [Hibiscus trionum]
MGLDDACNTCLVLGLGFPTNPETPHNTSKKPPATAAPATGFEPFLTLGLSDESYKVTVTKNVDVNKGGGCLQHRHHEEPPTSAAAAGDWCRPASPDPSAVSSFSSSRVRRERDFSSEDGVNARKKLRLNKEQSALLEESFKQHSALNPNQKQALARQLNLKPRQVEVWFQNRRARTKLKQTEVDCELLKRFCETLTNENRRLQKELQELKSMEMAYTNMPAATLTVCPSCERTGGGGNPKKPFSMPSKPRFYNHVTNPSAAY